MLDGYLARKLCAESKTGAMLDSVADICFVVCYAIRLIPIVQIPTMFWSIVPIAIVAGVASFAAIQEGHLIRTGRIGL